MPLLHACFGFPFPLALAGLKRYGLGDYIRFFIYLDMPILDRPYTVWICDSARPQIHGGGCCNDKGSESLLEHFRQALSAAELEQEVAVIPSSCMANCPHGISVRIQPGRVCYSQVKPADIACIIEEHLKGGQPVARLLAQELARE